jgi:hypothetical protein
MSGSYVHWWTCCAAVLLTACGQPAISGVYEDAMGITRYEFHRGGKVYMTVLGTTVAAEYRLDGDKVLVTSPQGTLVLTRQDGRLFGPMGMELAKQ